MMFYYGDMGLEVPENIYYPREDSLLLAKSLERLERKGKKCLEIGCGSGFLSILMAKEGAKVSATDISEHAVAVAMENARHNKADIEFFFSDLFEKITGTFDLIVFNPPYLPVDDEYTHESYDGGKTGRAVIGRFLEGAKGRLTENGKILLLISSLTGEKEVIEFAESCGFTPEVLAREKIDWEELIVLGLRG
ncbi:MAG: methyltransferase [Candidatus Aenigmarchaeota archaeon]|nr:methyltransferase [Candidatus Aenigmarchaeota archaeon]